jgi:4a-hydroxytetrahydrobiopterin dehydratase
MRYTGRMTDLTKQKCIPCEVGGVPLTPAEISAYAANRPLWKVSADQKKISRTFTFKDFKASLDFVNKVGTLAESEGHHPDISIHYNKVALELWTHAVGGLFVNDFILAAKIDALGQ